MATIKDYEIKYGKIHVLELFAVTEEGVVFRIDNGRFVEGCVGNDNKQSGIVRISTFPDSWAKWLDYGLLRPEAEPELAKKGRIEEALKSINHPLFIGDFQHGAFGEDQN